MWLHNRSETVSLWSDNSGTGNPGSTRSFTFPAPRGGDDRLVSAVLDRNVLGPRISQRIDQAISMSATEHTVAITHLLPWISNAAYDDASRTITWSEEGPGTPSIADAQIFWRRNGGTEYFSWRVIALGARTSLRLPELPILATAPAVEPALSDDVKVFYVGKATQDDKSYRQLRQRFDRTRRPNDYALGGGGVERTGTTTSVYCYTDGC
jgi:hypothetical protein